MQNDDVKKDFRSLGLESNLYSYQKACLDLGVNDLSSNFVIEAPTGSGKTLITKLAGLKILEANRKKIVYIFPLKALAEEKKKELTEFHSNYRVGIFTGDYAKGGYFDTRVCGNKSDILILTPERFDSSLRAWDRNSWLFDVGLVVFDEFHLLNDLHRGPRLEGLATRLKRINPYVKIIAMSATLSNISELGEFLDACPLRFTWRPTELDLRLRHFSSSKEKVSNLYEEVLETLEEDGQVLVFVNSRKKAEKLAAKIAERIMCLEPTHKTRLGIGSGESHQPYRYVVGYHHAGLRRDERNSVEELFRGRILKVIVSTPTLAWGLNLPARKVIVYDTSYFDGRTFVPRSILDVRQMAGRAGRPGLDKEGECVVFVPKWVDGSKYVVGSPELIRSKLDKENKLLEQLLAEFASKLSKTEWDVVEGLFKNSLAHLQGFLKSPHILLKSLEEKGFIRKVDENRYYVTRFGRVVSQLYIQPSSALTIKRFLFKIESPGYHDILFLTCILPECEPKIWMNFEEIRSISNQLFLLGSESSRLSLEKLREIHAKMLSAKELMAAIKGSLLLNDWISGLETETICKKYGIYSADLEALVANADWLIHSISRISSVVGNEVSSDLCRLLGIRVRYGITEDEAELLKIKGIGEKRLNQLGALGITRIENLAKASMDELDKIPGIGRKLAEKLVSTSKIFQGRMRKIKSTKTEMEDYSKTNSIGFLQDMDPYRLKRSMELRVTQVQGKSLWLVEGGVKEHFVKKIGSQYECDCKDFKNGTKHCKHILIVQRYSEESSFHRKFREFFLKRQEFYSRPLYQILPVLWLTEGSEDVPY